MMGLRPTNALVKRTNPDLRKYLALQVLLRILHSRS